MGYFVILLLVVGLLLWSLRSRSSQVQSEGRSSVSPQMLSGLAQPYRGLMGEAVEIEREVKARVEKAPPAIQGTLQEISLRISQLVSRALPRAQQGTELMGYLIRLKPSEPQHVKTLQATRDLEDELRAFVETLGTLRGKVYAILADASRLSLEGELARDMDDALIEISALEEAFADVRRG